MITCGLVTRKKIRFHYDLATVGFSLLWGKHIHHCLWEKNETPRQAQRQLIDRLADAAQIKPGSRVLDVGCGMGGSAVYLAQTRKCQVLGLTVSPVQRAWAATAAWLGGVGQRARFLCRDVETVEFAPRSFDIIWNIECTEHLFDKPAYFQRVARWLRPGGRIATCSWLAAEEPLSTEATNLLDSICRDCLNPSIGTAQDHLTWMKRAGLEKRSFDDLPAKVARTWEIGFRRVQRFGVQFLARLGGLSVARFMDSFDTILKAYATGAMKYGYFIGQAPAAISNGFLDHAEKMLMPSRTQVCRAKF